MSAASIVYIVDDDAGVRDGLTRLLSSAGFEAEAFASADAFLAIQPAGVPSCLLLDMRLREATGFDVQSALADNGRNIPIIFMTGYGTIPMSVRAMKAGAVEFLTKPIDDEAMLDAVQSALERDRERLEASETMDEWRRRFHSLTPREQQVMALAIGGLMNKQIAGELGTSEITAKVHKRRVMEKMGARSLADLVRMAEKLNIKALSRR